MKMGSERSSDGSSGFSPNAPIIALIVAIVAVVLGFGIWMAYKHFKPKYEAYKQRKLIRDYEASKNE